MKPRIGLGAVSAVLGMTFAIALAVYDYRGAGYVATNGEVVAYGLVFAGVIYVAVTLARRIFAGEGSKPVYWGDQSGREGDER